MCIYTWFPIDQRRTPFRFSIHGRRGPRGARSRLTDTCTRIRTMTIIIIITASVLVPRENNVRTISSWAHHYLPLFCSRRSICRADSEPDRTTLQLLSIICWRGCRYNLAIVSRATLLHSPSLSRGRAPSTSSPLCPLLALAAAPLSFETLTSVNGKQSK